MKRLVKLAKPSPQAMDIGFTRVFIVLLKSPNLEEDVDEVEDLAKYEFVDVGVVAPEGPQDVVDDGLPAGVVLLDAIEDVLIVHVLHEHAELSAWK